MALVMALGVVFVLTIVVATTLALTAAGSRDASRMEANQQALALAEAGLNSGLAQIAKQYPASKKSGNGTGSVTGGPVTYEAGTFSWVGTFDATTEQWDIIGTAVVKNPTGPGAADIQRTASAKIGIAPAAPWALFGIYAANPGAGCTTLKGGVTVNVPVYVASCLVLGGNTGSPPAPAKIWEPNDPATVSVHVGGNIDASPLNPAIGTTADPVKLISAGSCTPAPCDPSPRFNAESYPSLPLLLEPKVDAQGEYDKAQWSLATCTIGTQPFDTDGLRNHSRGTFDLLALPSYDCTAKNAAGTNVGRLAWDAATKEMEIEGAIYFDGSLSIGVGSVAAYTGEGTIYVNGTVDMKGIICGPGSTFNAAAPSCNMQWDTDLGSLLIVAANTQVPMAFGTPILRYADPESDGASNAWAKSSGTQGWALVDDGMRAPAAPNADGVSSITAGQLQDIAFENITYDPSAAYTLRIYGIGGNRRGVQTSISVNDSTFASGGPTIAAGSGAAWRSQVITGLITSQAALDGLRVRLQTTATGGGGPTAVQVHAVYLEQSVPTYTPDCATDPSDTPVAFSLSSNETRLEAGAWAVGTFVSNGQAEMGGSVFTEGCSAFIEGGGVLKAFISLPSGAPSMYTLADKATDFR